MTRNCLNVMRKIAAESNDRSNVRPKPINFVRNKSIKEFVTQPGDKVRKLGGPYPEGTWGYNLGFSKNIPENGTYFQNVVYNFSKAQPDTWKKNNYIDRFSDKFRNIYGGTIIGTHKPTLEILRQPFYPDIFRAIVADTAADAAFTPGSPNHNHVKRTLDRYGEAKEKHFNTKKTLDNFPKFRDWLKTNDPAFPNISDSDTLDSESWYDTYPRLITNRAKSAYPQQPQTYNA